NLASYELPQGLLVTAELPTLPLGGYQLRFAQADGRLVPAAQVWNRGQFDAVLGQTLPQGWAWLLPYATQQSPTLLVTLQAHCEESSGGSAMQSMTRATPMLEASQPADKTHRTAGRLLPHEM